MAGNTTKIDEVVDSAAVAKQLGDLQAQSKAAREEFMLLLKTTNDLNNALGKTTNTKSFKEASKAAQDSAVKIVASQEKIKKSELERQRLEAKRAQIVKESTAAEVAAYEKSRNGLQNLTTAVNANNQAQSKAANAATAASSANQKYGDQTAKTASQVNQSTYNLKDQEKALRDLAHTSDSAGGFFSSLKTNILSTLAPLGLLLGAFAAVKEAVENNVELSDSFVDVQRTAKLTANEVDNLGEQLKKLNTRTSLEKLLDIGFIGGRLGVAKEDLVSFIATVDQLSVVLQKEFPGGADAVATALGKIISVYKITQKEGITLEQALKNTGSAFLELAHSGQVNVQYLQDFALRTAGVAQIAKLSLPTMLAYGAVLSQSGISAQIAGTAVTRLISSLSTKREDYFAIAKLSDATLTIEKFTDLINTDTKAALELFFKGLKSGNPTQTEFSDRLDTLNLRTGQVKNSVIALAENQEILTKKTAIANKANEEGTSVAHNFELANNSLSASFDKIGNSIANAFSNSTLSRRIAELLNSITDTRTESQKLTEEFQHNKEKSESLITSLNPLIKRYDELKEKGSLTKVEQGELRRVTAAIGELLPGVTTKFDNYGNSLDINRAKVSALTKAQKELLELENRSALKSANKEFDNAQAGLPIAKKELTIAQDAKPSFLFGEAFNKGNIQRAKDVITRINGEAYTAAKNIRALGGVLTRAQQDIINYYEAIEKARVPKKQQATIVGDGLDITGGDDGVRTIDDIKADIKRINELKAPLDVASAQYKKYLVQLRSLKKELKEAMGGSSSGSNKQSNEFSQYLQQQKEVLEGTLQYEKASYDDRLLAIDAFEQSSEVLIRKGIKSKEFTQTEGNTKLLDVTNQSAKERIKIEEDAQKELARLFKEGLENEKRILANSEDTFRNAYASRILAADQAKNADLTALADQYEQGLIKTKEYNERKAEIESGYAIESAKESIKLAGDLIQVKKDQGEDTAKDEIELAKLQIRLSELVTGKKLSDLEKQKAKQKEINDAIKSLAEGAANFVIELVNAGFTNRKNQLAAEKDENDKQAQQEIDAVDRSLGTEEEKASRIAIIKAKQQAQNELIARKQKQIDIEKAKFDKAIAIARIIENTAIAITSVLPNYVLAAIIGALGAVQLATVLAQPIPQYAKGTKNAKGGLSIIGEEGAEKVDLPNGKSFISASTAQLINLPAGSKVTPHGETMRMIGKPDDLQRFTGGQQVPWERVIAAMEKKQPASKNNINIRIDGSFEKYRQNHFR